MMTIAFETIPVPLRTDTEGVVRVGGTRVTLDTVVGAFQDGATAEEIIEQYPALQLADVYFVIGYYLRQQAEVDAYLRERRALADQVRAQYATSIDANGFRDRLLARRAKDQS